ncbi:MAG TPA: limonene-1,2-epoxide hydrolase family protein [Bryobacteraceae bacterium]|nr:limonene-1,2-epoxide hydrolase family protein [Bryobacteraceae bacterium]
MKLTRDPIRNTPTRRSALSTAGFGIGALAALPGHANAAEMTAAEKANVQVVNDFCAAWPAHNLDRIMAFFAADCAYRVNETQEPYKGRQAVTDRIQSFLGRVQKFDVMETFAKGPMVFNERKDSFTSGPLKMWHGVGVFFLKDGEIVEWYDYTISRDLA